MDRLNLANLALALYVFVFGMLCVYGLHRYHLVYLYYKHRRKKARPKDRFEELPRVTIQLPMYNERYVAQRVIELACAVDYPSSRLQIQVLDDSTDDTVAIARKTVDRMRALGHDVVYMHRTNREGYKAGALDAGLKTATGEFICIFDADFLPSSEVLRETVHYFTDPQVGLVQVRWDHINRTQSLLTRIQAVLLDGHFVIEHGARNRSGRFMSFNGTAGIWRARCIQESGGWQHDTLTEDLDLSYRAQLEGWKFVFDPDVSAPAELPPEVLSFKSQQYRWAKGGAQTCRKLLPRILRAPLPFRVKVEAFFHLTSCTAYLYMMALLFLLYPVMYQGATAPRPDALTSALVDISLFIIAACSASTFYVSSQRELFRNWRDSLKNLPLLMALGAGIAVNNARATISGFRGRQSEFVRTPKFGLHGSADLSWRKRRAYRQAADGVQAWIEVGLGIYLFCCTVLTIQAGWITISIPFLILFMSGCFYIGCSSLVAQWRTGGSAPQSAGDEQHVSAELARSALQAAPSSS